MNTPRPRRPPPLASLNQNIRELNSTVSYGNKTKCRGCGRRALRMGRLLMPIAEYRKRDALFDAVCVLQPHVALQRTVWINEGDNKPKAYIIVSKVYCCDNTACVRAMETALARAPSWCIGELWNGPNEHHRVTSKASNTLGTSQAGPEARRMVEDALDNFTTAAANGAPPVYMEEDVTSPGGEA